MEESGVQEQHSFEKRTFWRYPSSTSQSEIVDMKRPTLILTLFISVAVAWGGLVLYKTILKKQESEKRIEDYKQRLSLNKKRAQNLEQSKRPSLTQSVPSQ